VTEAMLNEVLEIVRVVKKKPNATYDFDKPLRLQGLDSLDMIDVLFKLQDKYGFEVDEDSISENEWESISKIVAQIKQIQAQ